MPARHAAPRRILLLQGPSSGFFALLRDALVRRGARVERILFHPGDALFWRRPGGVHWRGRAQDWPGWIEARMRAGGVTDLLLWGDRRPLHPEAAAAAHRLGLRVHVMELGLLRPGRLTLEPDGPGAHMPRTAEGIRRLAARARAAGGPCPPGPAGAGFAAYAMADVAWNLASLLSPLTHPGRRRHQDFHPLAEYGGWAWKLASAGARRRRAARAGRAAMAAAETGAPLFLFALQLPGDAQIRARGPDARLADTLARAAASFSLHAPPEARLILRPHPLDNLLTPWGRIARRAAEAAAPGARRRLILMDGGDLAGLLPRLSGMVTVNSGAGIEALGAGIPVKALGRAVWDVPEMSHQGPLDGFWRGPQPPDPRLVADFRLALDWAAQVPGGMDGPAARLGAEAAAERILAPPRLGPAPKRG